MKKYLLGLIALSLMFFWVEPVSAQQCCIYEQSGGSLTNVGCKQPDNGIICATQAFNWSVGQGDVDPTADDRLGPNGVGIFQSAPAVCGTPTCVVNINLPVEFSSFEASYVGGSEVMLAWETASETDNAGFYVEHQIGSAQFEEIGFVEGNGTTTDARSYTFRATGLDAGHHVFQLKQVDFDGAFDYSQVVEATVELPSSFVLEPAYPNPFNPSTTIRFGTAVETDITVELYDAAGKLVRTLYEGVPKPGALNTITIDGSRLTSGTYLVKLTSSDFQTSRQIVLLK